MVLASKGQRPGMLLDVPQCTGQRPQQRIIWPKMAIVPKLRNSGLGQEFLDTTTAARIVTENKDKLDFIKIKNFYASKHTTQKVKRQATHWKILANHVLEKGLGYRAYKEPSQLHKKTNNPV